MNTQSNAVSESTVVSQGAAPAISQGRLLYWSVRRELWEHPSLYVAPLAVAGVVFLGFLLTLFHLPAKMRHALTLDPMQLHDLIEQPFDLAGALLMGTFIFTAMFYCIEALQRERRDRSILFWKSLPVSDATTVAAKTVVPFVALPLFTVGVTVVTQFVMLLASSAVLAGSGLSVTAYWAQVSFVQMSFLLLYHVITVHVLWSSPIYGWFLLVSAWARRAAFLWAVLPPLAICALEKLIFNTSHFAAFLGRQLAGDGTEAFKMPGTMPMDPRTHITPGRFLSTPGLWVALGVTAVFIATAVRLRRYRGPS